MIGNTDSLGSAPSLHVVCRVCRTVPSEGVPSFACKACRAKYPFVEQVSFISYQYRGDTDVASMLLRQMTPDAIRQIYPDITEDTLKKAITVHDREKAKWGSLYHEAETKFNGFTSEELAQLHEGTFANPQALVRFEVQIKDPPKPVEETVKAEVVVAVAPVDSLESMLFGG